MDTQLTYAAPDPEIVARLTAALDCHPVLAGLLDDRGIIDPQAARFFLNPDFSRLTDPQELKDMKKGAAISRISAKFHMTIIRMFSSLCEDIRTETGLNRVALSGGVFQNSIILTGLIKALEETRFQVFTHHLVPTNDGGISLGQAVIATSISDR